MRFSGKRTGKAPDFLVPNTLVSYKSVEPGGRPEFSGQQARVLRDFDCDESMARLGLLLYKIRFAEGQTINAYTKELTRVAI